MGLSVLGSLFVGGTLGVCLGFKGMEYHLTVAMRAERPFPRRGQTRRVGGAA